MRLFIGRKPRSIVLSSENYSLKFERLYDRSSRAQNGQQQQGNQNVDTKPPTVSIKTISENELAKGGYWELKNIRLHGLLGLFTINGDVYVVVIGGVQAIGFPRWHLDDTGKLTPDENINKILEVDFISLDTDVYDHFYIEKTEQNFEKLIHEHPCGIYKRLFADGSFYFAKDYDITNQVKSPTIAHNLDYAIDNFDTSLIWNANLINEIINWRSRLSPKEKLAFDSAPFLMFAIRGFCKTAVVNNNDVPATITVLSRISTEGFKSISDSEGMHEDGKVSTFIETETIVTTQKYLFSYTQVAGDVPLFFEIIDGQLLSSKKLKLLKQPGEGQYQFNKHFDTLESKFGIVSIVNLLKSRSDSQEALAVAYKQCADNRGIKINNIQCSINNLNKSPHKILYQIKKDVFECGAFAYNVEKGIYLGRQTGVIRISAADPIEKPMLLERLISKEVIELATKELDNFDIDNHFFELHDKLYSDNQFWLERIQSKNHKGVNKNARMYFKLFSSHVKLFDPIHFYISQYLKQFKAQFTYKKDIKIFAGTFNVGGKLSRDDVSQWLFPNGINSSEGVADVYVFGLEEVVELTPGHMLVVDPYIKQFWEKKLLDTINKYHPDSRFTKIWSSQLGGVLLVLFMKSSESTKVKHIEGDVKKTGFGGITSNKGAVAVSFNYSATRFCIIVSHLAAGLENVEQRHNDYKMIFKNIRFSRGLRIKDHDAILWMGDFNYRILMSNEDVRQLIAMEKYKTLFEKDQLNQQMIAGESFPYFHEMEISFPPTYKFDIGTKRYDTSEKFRIPAWTDRILSRGDVIKQLTYTYAPDITFSDHRPVSATFSANVTVVDERKKSELSAVIHSKLMEKLEGYDEDERIAFLNEGNFKLEDLDDELFGDAHVEISKEQKKTNRLPPPSSDIRKWWVGNGKQVKVFLDVDVDRFMLNPKRDINPFDTDQTEPVYVERKQHLE